MVAPPIEEIMTTYRSNERADIFTVLGAELRNNKSISRKHIDLLVTAHKALSDLIIDHGDHADVQDITTAIGKAVTAKALAGKRSETARLQLEAAEMRRMNRRAPATAQELAWQLVRLKGRG
jgi:hypothetical protein